MRQLRTEFYTEDPGTPVTHVVHHEKIKYYRFQERDCRHGYKLNSASTTASLEIQSCRKGCNGSQIGLREQTASSIPKSPVQVTFRRLKHG